MYKICILHCTLLGAIISWTNVRTLYNFSSNVFALQLDIHTQYIQLDTQCTRDWTYNVSEMRAFVLRNWTQNLQHFSTFEDDRNILKLLLVHLFSVKGNCFLNFVCILCLILVSTRSQEAEFAEDDDSFSPGSLPL